MRKRDNRTYNKGMNGTPYIESEIKIKILFLSCYFLLTKNSHTEVETGVMIASTVSDRHLFELYILHNFLRLLFKF